MIESRYDGDRDPDLGIATEEDWNAITACAELMAQMGEQRIVYERTITSPNARIEITKRVRPGISTIELFKEDDTDPVTKFVLDDLGELDDLPEVAPANRMTVASDILFVFNDVAEELNRTGTQYDAALLAHLENYAAYLRDDCKTGDIDSWMRANMGFRQSVEQALRPGSRVTLEEYEFFAVADSEERVNVLLTKFKERDRQSFRDRPYIQIIRSSAGTDARLTLLVTQSGDVNAESDYDFHDPYQLTSSGELSSYGAQATMGFLFGLVPESIIIDSENQ
jgi:hypothetical protein